MASQIWEGPLKTSGASCEFYLLPKPLCWSMFYVVQLRRMIWSRRDEPYGLTPERNRIHRTAYSRIVKTQGHSEQLGATQKLGASGNIQQASRLASAPVCAVPTAHRRPDCCPRPDRSTSSSPGVVLWVTMVDLGQVEVPRAHWSGGRAAGMCGRVEPTSGILCLWWPPRPSISIFLASHSSRPSKQLIKGPAILFRWSLASMRPGPGSPHYARPRNSLCPENVNLGLPADCVATVPSPDRFPPRYKPGSTKTPPQARIKQNPSKSS